MPNWLLTSPFNKLEMDIMQLDIEAELKMKEQSLPSQNTQEDGNDSESTTASAIRNLESLYSNRYLHPREKVPKQKEWFETLHSWDEDRFKQELRMTRQSFSTLLGLIQDHRVFQNNSEVSQAPVELQLSATLDAFGGYGSSASVGKRARLFSIR